MPRAPLEDEEEAGGEERPRHEVASGQDGALGGAVAPGGGRGGGRRRRRHAGRDVGGALVAGVDRDRRRGARGLDLPEAGLVEPAEERAAAVDGVRQRAAPARGPAPENAVCGNAISSSRSVSSALELREHVDVDVHLDRPHPGIAARLQIVVEEPHRAREEVDRTPAEYGFVRARTAGPRPPDAGRVDRGRQPERDRR